ncbi:MAG: serine hydrolase domain-containing protein, partial [Rubripirellula sp.]
MQNSFSISLPKIILVFLVISFATRCVAADDPVDIAESAISRIIEQGITDGQMSGAVVMIANQEKILFENAYGYRLVSDQPEPMTIDTLFDLASITKPVATATSVMHLVQEGKIQLDRPVSLYLPEFNGGGK